VPGSGTELAHALTDLFTHYVAHDIAGGQKSGVTETVAR
jgi:hypothetical protein